MTTTLPPFRTGRPRREQGFVRPLDGPDLPFTIVEGAEPGPCLLVTAGVHASEYCSIEAAIRLARTEPREIRGTLVVLPLLNVAGFARRSIYVMPEDGRNLNRMFPGDPAGTASQRLAHWLVSAVYPGADAYLDLHGGDLSESLEPFTLFPAGCERSRALAEVFGIPVAVAAGGEGYTIDAAHRLGVPSLLPEVGGNGLWDERGVGRMSDGIRRVMAHLGMIDASPSPPAPLAVVTMWVPPAPCDGLWYPGKDLAEPVAAGEVLGEIRDVFGAVRATIRSERDGFVLYRLASLAVNRGEALLGVGTPVQE